MALRTATVHGNDALELGWAIVGRLRQEFIDRTLDLKLRRARHIYPTPANCPGQ